MKVWELICKVREPTPKEAFEAAKITTRRESDGASVPVWPEYFQWRAAFDAAERKKVGKRK